MEREWGRSLKYGAGGNLRVEMRWTADKPWRREHIPHDGGRWIDSCSINSHWQNYKDKGRIPQRHQLIHSVEPRFTHHIPLQRNQKKKRRKPSIEMERLMTLIALVLVLVLVSSPADGFLNRNWSVELYLTRQRASNVSIWFVIDFNLIS